MANWGYCGPVKQVLSVIGALLLLCSCQTAFVPTNQPLSQNAQGMPEYRSGYALLPMLQRPQGEIVFIMAFSVVIAWSAIVKVVMTPIQWWNGNCTVEYSK